MFKLQWTLQQEDMCRPQYLNGVVLWRGACGVRGCAVCSEGGHPYALITRPANAGTHFTHKLASPLKKVTPLQHGKDVYFLHLFSISICILKNEVKIMLHKTAYFFSDLCVYF